MIKVMKLNYIVLKVFAGICLLLSVFVLVSSAESRIGARLGRPGVQVEKAVAQQGKGVIHVNVENLRNNNGQVCLLLFNSGTGFPSDPNSAFMRKIAPIVNNRAETEFNNVPYGEYAIAVFHDENMNKAVDMNSFNAPKEGYGVSQNVKGKFGPPSYEDAKFSFSKSRVSGRIMMIYPGKAF